MKKVIVQDVYFEATYKPRMIQHKDKGRFGGLIVDDKLLATHIRVVGTDGQIDSKINDYAKQHKLTLDEVYNYQVEPKGSYWYNIIKNPDAHNVKAAADIESYTQVYKDNGSKALLVNTIPNKK